MPFSHALKAVIITLLSAVTAFSALAAKPSKAKAKPTPTPTPEKREAAPPAQQVYPVALPNYNEETATRLQIFLDNVDFGPGKIDGRMGEFFRKALISYKHA